MTKTRFLHFVETGQINFSDGNIKFFGVDMIMIPTKSMAVLQNLMLENYGSSSNKVMYEAGYDQVKTAFSAFDKQFNLKEMDFLTFKNIFSPTMQLGGWGDVDIVESDFKNGEIRVIIRDNMFSTSYKKEFGKQKESVDHYLRGVFAAAASFISGEKCDCEEVSCIAKGDEYCEFITRKTDLG